MSTNNPEPLNVTNLRPPSQRSGTPWSAVDRAEKIQLNRELISTRAAEALALLGNLASDPDGATQRGYPRLAALMESASLIRDTVAINAMEDPEKRRVLRDMHATAPDEYRTNLAIASAIAEYAAGRIQTALQLANEVPDNHPGAYQRDTLHEARNHGLTGETFKEILYETERTFPEEFTKADNLVTKANNIRDSFPRTGRSSPEPRSPGTLSHHTPQRNTELEK